MWLVCRVLRRRRAVDCTSVPDGSADLTAWTNSFQNIQCYDTLKVNAILNEIEGKSHHGVGRGQDSDDFRNEFSGSKRGAEADRGRARKGGYLDAAGTPTASLLSEIEFVDDAIGEMVNEDQGSRTLRTTR